MWATNTDHNHTPRTDTAHGHYRPALCPPPADLVELIEELGPSSEPPTITTTPHHPPGGHHKPTERALYTQERLVTTRLTRGGARTVL